MSSKVNYDGNTWTGVLYFKEEASASLVSLRRAARTPGKES